MSVPTLVLDENGFLWMSAKAFADAVAHQSSADDALLKAATQEPIANRDDMVKRFLVSDRSGFDAPRSNQEMLAQDRTSQGVAVRNYFYERRK